MNLCCENLSFSYGNHKVLKDINFSLAKGEFLSVLGPNGVGKSTLFRCILGILEGYTGFITIDGKDIHAFSRKDLAKRIAYIPQIHRPTFGYTVLDTVLMGTTRQTGVFSSPKQEQVKTAREAMEMMGIEKLYDRNFAHLSGGEQQLVLVARAIAQQAEILVMDEPTSSLDYGNQIRVLEQVQGLSKHGYAVLMSTHNPQFTLTYGGKILALAGGRVAAYGEAQKELTSELMYKLYGINVNFVETGYGKVIIPSEGGVQHDVPLGKRYDKVYEGCVGKL